MCVLLGNLCTVADIFLKCLSSADGDEAAGGGGGGGATAAAQAAEQVELAKLIKSTHGLVKKQLEAHRGRARGRAGDGGEGAAAYSALMRGAVFGQVNLGGGDGGYGEHHYHSSIAASSRRPKQAKIVRIAQELASFTENARLPPLCI